MAEAYFDNKLREANMNLRRNQKTVEGFNRLPDVFTTEDVMRCFNLQTESAVWVKISRFQKDRLIEKAEKIVVDGKTKVKYRKIGIMI